MRVTVIGMIHIYIMYIMNIVLVNIYFQYIMLKFINSCDAHVQHLLFTNIPFSDKNKVDGTVYFFASRLQRRSKLRYFQPASITNISLTKNENPKPVCAHIGN